MGETYHGKLLRERFYYLLKRHLISHVCTPDQFLDTDRGRIIFGACTKTLETVGEKLLTSVPDIEVEAMFKGIKSELRSNQGNLLLNVTKFRQDFQQALQSAYTVNQFIGAVFEKIGIRFFGGDSIGPHAFRRATLRARSHDGESAWVQMSTRAHTN